MTTYPHPACMEPDGGDGPCAGYNALDRELTKALNLLVAARVFSHQTIIDANKFAAHSRELDAFMTGKAGDKPEDRYDSPERKEHRAFVNRLFRRQDRRPGMRKKPQNRQDLPG